MCHCLGVHGMLNELLPLSEGQAYMYVIPLIALVI